MIRAIARQAEAERERRAKVIHAEGELQASEKSIPGRQGTGPGATGHPAALSGNTDGDRCGQEHHHRVSAADGHHRPTPERAADARQHATTELMRAIGQGSRPFCRRTNGPLRSSQSLLWLRQAVDARTADAYYDVVIAGRGAMPDATPWIPCPAARFRPHSDPSATQRHCTCHVLTSIRIKRKLKSIKSKILTFAILATLIPSMGLGLLSFWRYQVVLNDNVSHELRTLASDTNGRTDDVVQGRAVNESPRAGDLLHSHRRPVGRNGTAAGLDPHRSGRMELYLRSVQTNWTRCLELTLSDATGQVVAMQRVNTFTGCTAGDLAEHRHYRWCRSRTTALG